MCVLIYMYQYNGSNFEYRENKYIYTIYITASYTHTLSQF